MKLFKSIRWRLQIFYGLLLTIAVTATFGTDYQLKRDALFHNAQLDLSWHTADLIDFMKTPPPLPPDPGAFSPGRPPPRRPPGGLHLPPHDLNVTSIFDATGTNGFYFIIWSVLGEELMRSTNAPMGLVMPIRHTDPLRGAYYEWVNNLPPYTILVGHSMARELTGLHRDLLKSAGIAVTFLCLILWIGWGVAGRMIKPIETISATAAKISAGDLSRRINVAETESELGRLASVLNSTFARLETAFAQQRQFTADAAHELRTPVSVMLTQTQTALNRERSAAEYRETLEACQRASQRMRKLIESLLELARLDAGQETLKGMKFDLSQTARDCVELVRPLAAARGITINCDLQPVESYGDAERLAQVITNLLANAVQYNKDNGEVRISAKAQGSVILLAVSDTGSGISSEDLPHVFDRFYRADPSRSSGQTGLGLAICKAIVEAHGGTISISSQLGTGTTFTVVLPII